MYPDTIVGPAVVHSTGSIQYANREFCALVGADSRDAVEGRPLGQFLTGGSMESLSAQFEQLSRGNARKRTLRFTLRGVDSTQRDVIAVSSPVNWDGTRLIRTSFVDISGPDGSLSLRETAMHEAPIGITIADVTLDDEPLVYVNDRFLDLTGYRRDEILGRNCRFLQGTETRDEPVARMRAALEAEQSVTVELRNYRADGTQFWNRVTLVPIENEDGKVTHYLGFQEDVTEVKSSEQERFLFRSYAETSNAAMFITDADGTIEYVNPAFERTTGYAASEAIGKTPRILKSGEQDDAFYADLWETITAGETWTGEITNRTESGELYEATQEITPITDDRGEIQYYVAVERTVTEQRLRQQVLSVLNRILRHNVRNSVTVIDAQARFIESDAAEQDVQATARTIRDHAARLKQLTDRAGMIRTLIDLLDEESDPHPVGLSEVGSVAEEYSEAYAEANIDVTVANSDGAVIRYGAIFEVVLEELLENAVEHSDRETPQVEVTVTETARGDHTEAIVEVADDGPEIPRATWEVIKSGEETQICHTTGIGLWVVYWAVTAIGGTIDLSRNEPRGNVITLRLPVTTRTN